MLSYFASGGVIQLLSELVYPAIQDKQLKNCYLLVTSPWLSYRRTLSIDQRKQFSTDQCASITHQNHRNVDLLRFIFWTVVCIKASCRYKISIRSF